MSHDQSGSRRAFFKTLGMAGAGYLMAQHLLASEEMPGAPNDESDADQSPENLASKGEVPRRRFGRHQEVVVSAMALGGHTFATAPSGGESIRMVHEAVDNGITFMDNAWEYHDGKSEELMGKALEGRRDKGYERFNLLGFESR
jgi:hypothetical protein